MIDISAMKNSELEELVSENVDKAFGLLEVLYGSLCQTGYPLDNKELRPAVWAIRELMAEVKFSNEELIERAIPNRSANNE
tara:strand:- start:466 stop:708 length:243 start_codon:yes stop_codon:yes gene_type:complete